MVEDTREQQHERAGVGTVDAVEDVVEPLSEPAPIRAAMGEGWERVSLGMVETEEGPLLLVDVAALIAGPGAESRAA